MFAAAGGRAWARVWVIPLVLVLLASAACGGGREPEASPTPAASPSSEAALAQECTAEAAGYRIGYPEGWHVARGDDVEPCRWFHPEPFELPRATEAPGIAVHVAVEDVPFERVVEGLTRGEVTSRESTTVAGMEAVRVQAVDAGETLYPEGTRITTYAVRWDGRTLVASTTSVAEAGDYEQNVDVLDRMMDSLERLESAACSAPSDAELPAQAGLPDAVAEMRIDIVEAAKECDFERLAELARRGDGTFEYSFGASGAPAEYWREQEASERGPDPMRFLVGVLQRPYGTVQVEGETQYVWPSAFAYDDWQDVPREDREALEPLYDEEDFEGFARFGGYVGYRVGIAADGDWEFFVAGD